ncbi:tellurite resistance TerB family protein [Kaarinaea lacus]
MSLQNLLNQFLGATNAAPTSGNTAQSIGDTLGNISSNIPGGLAGGAAAGGIMALLVSSKSARKFAGTAATYGGAALLGGLAYKAFKNWQQNNSQQAASHVGAQHIMLKNDNAFNTNATLSTEFQLTLIKAMIAAAKADGHIDDLEQQRIFKAVEQMDLSMETKGVLFDLLRKPISIEELAHGVVNLEQRTELFLASCLVINPDHPAEQTYLDKLAVALKLPRDLAQQLQLQAQDAMAEAA